MTSAYQDRVGPTCQDSPRIERGSHWCGTAYPVDRCRRRRAGEILRAYGGVAPTGPAGVSTLEHEPLPPWGFVRNACRARAGPGPAPITSGRRYAAVRACVARRDQRQWVVRGGAAVPVAGGVIGGLLFCSLALARASTSSQGMRRSSDALLSTAEACAVLSREHEPQATTFSAARSSSSMSIFFISSIAAMTRCAFSVSGPLSPIKAVGVICQDRPNLALSQPHGLRVALGDLVPVRVDLLLGLAEHVERDGFAESRIGTTVQRDERLAIELEPTVITVPLGARPCGAIVVILPIFDLGRWTCNTSLPPV